MEDLVKLIKKNPKAKFIVDNDCWTMLKAGHECGDACEDECVGELVRYDGVTARGDGGYGSGNTYGGDILQALAEIVGVEIESV